MDNFDPKYNTTNKFKADHYYIDKREVIAGLFDNMEQADKVKQDFKNLGFFEDQCQVYQMDPVSKDGINISLIGMGFPLEEAEYFERAYRQGKVLVVIKPEDKTEDAYELLIRGNADIGASLHTETIKKEIASMKRRLDVQQQNFKDREMIAGIFESRDTAFKVADELKRLNFSSDQIRVYYFDSEIDKEHLELIGMGFPVTEARYFERAYNRGETLLTVKSGKKVEEVMEIIMRNGGDIGTSAYHDAEQDHNIHSFTNNYELGMD